MELGMAAGGCDSPSLGGPPSSYLEVFPLDQY